MWVKTVVPLQLLAYPCAVLRGYDVDKPENQEPGQECECGIGGGILVE